MTNFTQSLLRAAATSIALVAVAQPGMAQDRRNWEGESVTDRTTRLVGAGVPFLYRELKSTDRGRAFVMRNFDRNEDGRINRREAEDANRAFAQRAGSRRDSFDWGMQDRVVVIDRPAERPQWNREAMRSYNFRQTDQGAMLTLQEDVLFQTASAQLRPGAIEKLRPLADYLMAERGVRVSIDGHTDSRGTDGYNQQLSERRAESVRAAFDDMGVTRVRFAVEGHGESNPVATNATAAGMRLNRRVEVTLLGQRADNFGR